MRDAAETGVGIGVVFVFEGGYVTCIRSKIKPPESIAAGTIKTANLNVDYTIMNVENVKSIILGHTRSSYPLVFLSKEKESVSEAIRHIAEWEKSRVLQLLKHPDYGYEVVGDIKSIITPNAASRRTDITTRRQYTLRKPPEQQNSPNYL